jgi:acyl dehydratase
MEPYSGVILLAYVRSDPGRVLPPLRYDQGRFLAIVPAGGAYSLVMTWQGIRRRGKRGLPTIRLFFVFAP